MPPLRRRKVGSQVNISVGTLLADSEKERLTQLREQETVQQTAERLERKEEQKVDRAYVESERKRIAEERDRRDREEAIKKAQEETRQKEAQRIKDYQKIFDDYKNGVISYETAVGSLDSAAKGGETNKEIADQLKSAVVNIKLIKTNRDIDKKIADFNSGQISYSELKTSLDNVKTDNEAVVGRISQAVSAARATENTRAIQRGLADYQSGKKSIDQYLTDMAVLKADPGQKNPAELQKIEDAIQTGMKIKTDLAVQSTYSNWQTGAIGDGEAISFFRAMVAQARTPEDAKNYATALANITSSVQKKGAASAEAFDKHVNETTSKNHEAYKKILERNVKACDGDASCVMDAFDQYGEFLKSQAGLGGSFANHYLKAASMTGKAGAIEAAIQEREKILREIDALEKEANDPKISIEMYALKKGQIAALAQSGANSMYQPPESKSDFLQKRKDAGDDLINRELQLQKEAEAASGLSKQEVLGAYSALASSKNLYGEGGKGLKEAFAAAGLAFDGSAADKAKFFDWMAQAPEDIANQVFDILHPARTVEGTGEVKRPTDENRDKFVTDITKSLAAANEAITGRAKILDTFITVANPGITKEEKKDIIKIITTTEKVSKEEALALTKNSGALVTRIRTDAEIAAEEEAFRRGQIEIKKQQRPITTIPDPVQQAFQPDNYGITIDSGMPGQNENEQREQERKQNLAFRREEDSKAFETSGQSGPLFGLGKGFEAPFKAAGEAAAGVGDFLTRPGAAAEAVKPITDTIGQMFQPPQEQPQPRDAHDRSAGAPRDAHDSGAYSPSANMPVFDFGIAGGGSGIAKVEQDLNTIPRFDQSAFSPMDFSGSGPTITESDYPTFDLSLWSRQEESSGSGGGGQFMM